MKHIIFQKEGEIARITFHRPEVLNAFNKSMIGELKSTLEQIKTDPKVKVLIVNGAGRAFSAGVDLKSATAEDFQKEGIFMELGREAGELLEKMPQVTIAQVHGYCFTGALEMMLFFDLVFCTEETQFGDTHAKWSIMPRWGMTQRLSRRVGLIKAKEMTFRAMRVKGDEAERIGLVNRAFLEGELESNVKQIAGEILENSFEAIAAIKRLYNEGYATTLSEGLKLEAAADSGLSSTDEQIAQFEEKKFKNKERDNQ